MLEVLKRIASEPLTWFIVFTLVVIIDLFWGMRKANQLLRKQCVCFQAERLYDIEEEQAAQRVITSRIESKIGKLEVSKENRRKSKKGLFS